MDMGASVEFILKNESTKIRIDLIKFIFNPLQSNIFVPDYFIFLSVTLVSCGNLCKVSIFVLVELGTFYLFGRGVFRPVQCCLSIASFYCDKTQL